MTRFVNVVCIALFIGIASCIRIDANGYTIVPRVGRVPQECVHGVASGSFISWLPSGDISVTHPETREVEIIKSCRNIPHVLEKLQKRNMPGQYDGWLAYTSYEAPTDFDSFLGYFSVPDEPQNDPEVLYLFTGLQNVNWIPIVDPEPDQFDIIQPVLQYPGDDGNYWSVKSWYVTLTDDVLYSNEIQVNTGDLIFGNMSKTDSTTWYIGGTDNQSGQNTNLVVSRPILSTQPWSYNTAECYGCEGCSYEPIQPCQFSQLALEYNGQPVTPSWTAYTSPNPICDEVAHVKGPAAVYITFQQS